MAILIHTSGIVEKIKPLNGNDFTVEEIQKHIQGYFQVAARFQKDEVSEEFFVLCDEEGLIKELPFNSLGSEIALKHLVGPVLICNNIEFK